MEHESFENEAIAALMNACAKVDSPWEHESVPARYADDLRYGWDDDPATPYVWATSLASQLRSGHLLTFEGDGHTAYGRGSSCIDDAVDGYLVNAKLPPDGTRCPAP